MERRKRSRVSIVLVHGLLILAIALGVGGCDSNGADSQDPIAVEGTWLIDGQFDWDGDGNTNAERWVITGSSITYESSLNSMNFTTNYKADIISYTNSGLNAGETAVTDGIEATGRNPGFAVIRFTEVDNQGWGTVDKYSVFRWVDDASDPSMKGFTQGSKDSNLDGDNDPFTGTYINVVFDTPAEAEAEVTVGNGFFTTPPSQGATKQ